MIQKVEGTFWSLLFWLPNDFQHRVPHYTVPVIVHGTLSNQPGNGTCIVY